MNAMKRLTCVAAATACAFAGAATAHTDEAVADAEALLKMTTERAQRREASSQDVSIARYHPLGCLGVVTNGSIRDIPARNNGGRSSLSIDDHADSFKTSPISADGDEPVKAEIGLRADKIDAMTTSPELCRQVVADVDAYLFDDNPPAKTDDEVREAEKAAEAAQERYKAQDLDRTTATLAEIRGLEAPYTAGKITREAYCASGQGPLLADFAGWMQTRAQFGQAGLLGLIAAKRKLFQFKALCHTK